MKSDEMELQAIKEKLQRVRQEPLSSEATRLPWVPTSPRVVSPSAGDHGASSIRPSLHKYAATVETLKQRSNQHLKAFEDDRQFSGYVNEVAAPVGESDWQMPQPTAPEPWEMEVYLQALAKQAAQINQLSERQEAAMLAMKAICDRLALEGYDMAAWNDQNGASAPLATALCEFHAAVVPTVQQTRQGAYVLNYREVDLYQDQRQAQEVAAGLRSHHQDHAGGDLITRLATLDWGRLWARALNTLHQGLQWGNRQINNRGHQHRQSTRQVSKPYAKHPPQGRPQGAKTRSRITPLDGLIWFSGAAIVRICIDFLVAQNPVLFPYIAILMLGIGLFVLYRATLAPRPDYALGFRLLIVIAGLVVGSRF